MNEKKPTIKQIKAFMELVKQVSNASNYSIHLTFKIEDARSGYGALYGGFGYEYIDFGYKCWFKYVKCENGPVILHIHGWDYRLERHQDCRIDLSKIVNIVADCRNSFELKWMTNR